MITQLNIHELQKTCIRWNQAIVRTYGIDMLLTDEAVRWLNGESSVVFKIAKWTEDPDEGGPYTLLNVYAETEKDFGKALQSMELLEQRIECVKALDESRTFFADSIADLVKKDALPDFSK
jgi:hypothetical protein